MNSIFNKTDREFMYDEAVDAWMKFEKTGTISDYLGYCDIVYSEGMPLNADQDSGAGNQAPQYR